MTASSNSPILTFLKHWSIRRCHHAADVSDLVSYKDNDFVSTYFTREHLPLVTHHEQLKNVNLNISIDFGQSEFSHSMGGDTWNIPPLKREFRYDRDSKP